MYKYTSTMDFAADSNKEIPTTESNWQPAAPPHDHQQGRLEKNDAKRSTTTEDLPRSTQNPGTNQSIKISTLAIIASKDNIDATLQQFPRHWQREHLETSKGYGPPPCNPLHHGLRQTPSPHHWQKPDTTNLPHRKQGNLPLLLT